MQEISKNLKKELLKILKTFNVNIKRTTVIINTAQILHMYIQSIIKLQKIKNSKFNPNYEKA